MPKSEPSAAKSRLLVVTTDVAAVEERLAGEPEYPRQDFRELADALDARIVSFSDLRRGCGWLTHCIERVFGRGSALAWFAFRQKADFYFTTAENAGYPLAFLLKFRPAARHVMIAHRISAAKKRLIACRLRLFRRVDQMICYSHTQSDFARDQFGVPDERCHRIDFQVDAQFYTPGDTQTPGTGVVSVGRELRDYPTLFEAVRDTDIPVTVVASSPWSKRADQTRNRNIPQNVTLRKGLSYCELRDLYRTCALVVVPLQDVDSPAGITSILEAQAVGKPVIVTKSPGIVDSIEPGKTVVTVPPSDPNALRAAIQRLLASPDEAANIAKRGHAAALEGKTLDHYIERIRHICQPSPASRCPHSSPPASPQPVPRGPKCDADGPVRHPKTPPH